MLHSMERIVDEGRCIVAFPSRGGGKPSAARWIRAAASPEQDVGLVFGIALAARSPGKEHGDVLLAGDGEVFEITIPPANRLRDWDAAPKQMPHEVDFPLHRLRGPRAVVQLQGKFPAAELTATTSLTGAPRRRSSTLRSPYRLLSCRVRSESRTLMPG
jgi:hypothetical protein